MYTGNKQSPRTEPWSQYFEEAANAYNCLKQGVINQVEPEPIQNSTRETKGNKMLEK